MMSAWKMLEALLRENKQYRGDTGVTFKDLDALMQGSEHRQGLTGKPADPKGEVVDCKYQFDPLIWGKWYPSIAPALTMASTDNDTTNQHAGKSQGGMTFKTNWGQKVVNVPGKARGDFERLPSSMDRYDLIMQGEVGDKPHVNKRTGQTTIKKVGMLYRIAYAPSIGSSEERRARLQAMLAGQDPGPLTRRPQPHRPEPTRQELDKWGSDRARALAIQGKRKAAADSDDLRMQRGEPPLPDDEE